MSPPPQLPSENNPPSGCGSPPANGHHVAIEWDSLPPKIANVLPVMIWRCDPEWRTTLFNDCALEFVGCSLREALKGAWEEAVHPDDVEKRRAAHAAARGSCGVFETEYRMRAAPGGYRHILEWGAPQFDPRAEFLGYFGLAIDITRRQPGYGALRWLSAAVEQSPSSIVITDLHGSIEYVNPKFTEVTGYSFDEVRGQNPRILKSGETTDAEYRGLWDTIRAGVWTGEFHNRKKNGEFYWESARISPIRDENGKATHYIAVKEDITARKSMEAALRASEQRFRMAAEAAEICIYDVDLNTGAAQAFGSDPFLTNMGPVQDWTRAIHPEDRERVSAALEQRRKEGGAWRGEYRVIDSDGVVHHLLDYGAPECDGRWIGAVRDITSTKLAEKAQARLAGIVRCSNDAIISLDTEGILKTWNAAAEKLYGYSTAEILGRRALELSPPEFRQQAKSNIAQVLSGRPLLNIETSHMRRSGVSFPVSLSASSIVDSYGKIFGASVIIRDITEQQRAQEALLESENRFRALVQNSNDLITLIDPQGTILYDSPGISEMLGICAEQRLGHPLMEWLHPDELAQMQVMHAQLLQAPDTRLRVQLRLRHSAGNWVWCDSWAVNLTDQPGVRALALNFRDITQLKGVETALRESEERHRRLIQDASDSIFALDLKGRFTSINGARLSGYSEEELLGKDVRDIVAPEHRSSIGEVLSKSLDNGPRPPIESEIILRDGRRLSVEVTRRLQMRDGVPVGLLCVARDISQRKRMERLEKSRREVLEMVARNQPLDAVLCRVREIIEQYYPASVVTIPLAEDSGPQPCASGGAGRDSQTCMGHHSVPIRVEDRIVGALDIQRHESWQPAESEQVLLDSMAKLVSIALEHRQLTNRLAYQAQHDPLTGLPNRALLEECLRQAVALARRQPNMAAVLYVDLDRFKYINDTLGHDIGDLLLQETGKRLAAAVRASDTLARTGGDEFVAVLSSISSADDAEIVGERILEAMRAPFQVREHELFVSASVGLSVFPDDGGDPATLQKHADVAMYEAKNRGRNRFQRFSRSLNSTSGERLELENQLHWALDRGELELFYQSQFQLPGRRLAGLEALLRWNHPKWGYVPPNRFIPVAEETGLIIPISLWVLRTACRQHQIWCAAGYPPIKIAVNISATQFVRSNLAENVAEALKAHNMAPKFLELELTEGVLMRDAVDAARQIADLRALGVRLSIDDFGTGYSSLSYLQRLPIDDLKIDQCFVRGIDRAPRTQPLVQAIVGLAHGLNLTATAEGVETARELAILQDLGCDQVQGFLLGKPQPVSVWDEYWQALAPPVAGAMADAPMILPGLLDGPNSTWNPGSSSDRPA